MQIEPFDLERWMTHWETIVRFDLAESGIEPLSLSELLALSDDPDAPSRLLALPLGYSEARGTAELRGLLTGLYRDVSPDEILVTTGAIEANFLLFNALLRPDDEVIVVEPCYQQLVSLPRALGCRVLRWTLRSEDGFRYRLSDLERLVSGRTRLIVINSPHNPTGAVLSTGELAAVYGIAEAAGARVLSDEAYRWLTLPDQPESAPPMRDLGPLGISVGTVSKPFGLPGLRIGWFAATPELVERCWSLRDYVTLSPGKLNDALACIALRQREQLHQRAAMIAARNLSTLRAWIREREGMIELVPPRGGLLALLRYRLDLPSSELADRLAAEASVMLAPGSAFGLEHHLRVGFGADPERFAAGLRQVTPYLEQLRSEYPAG